MIKCLERLYNGLIKENPTFVLMLGMCPTLAVTTSAINGLGMGLTTMAVLILSNMLISMLRKIIPDGVRIPAFIVVIASFVTVVELLLEAYIPSLYDSLGLYIPLIVVNCIILGRALPASYEPLTIFILAPGAFFVLAFLIAIMNKINLLKGRPTGKGGNCDQLCAECSNHGCLGRRIAKEDK